MTTSATDNISGVFGFNRLERISKIYKIDFHEFRSVWIKLQNQIFYKILQPENSRAVQAHPHFYEKMSLTKSPHTRQFLTTSATDNISGVFGFNRLERIWKINKTDFHEFRSVWIKLQNQIFYNILQPENSRAVQAHPHFYEKMSLKKSPHTRQFLTTSETDNISGVFGFNRLERIWKTFRNVFKIGEKQVRCVQMRLNNGNVIKRYRRGFQNKAASFGGYVLSEWQFLNENLAENCPVFKTDFEDWDFVVTKVMDT